MQNPEAGKLWQSCQLRSGKAVSQTLSWVNATLAGPLIERLNKRFLKVVPETGV
jgi:hypothetical protein